MDISSWDLSIKSNDHLLMDDCDLVELANRYDTPLHAVSKRRLVENYGRFFNAFKSFYPKLEICYSYKTNCIPGILSLLHREGVGAEVVSPYEFWLALKLGVPPEKIIYNGPNKNYEALRLAVEKGIRLINIDSLDEITKLDDITFKMNKSQAIGVRILPITGWRAQFGLGINSGEAFEAFSKLSKIKRLRVKGLHFHIGTMVKDPMMYINNIKMALSFAKHIKTKLGINIEYLDIGGGFGVPTIKTFNARERSLHYYYRRCLVPPRQKVSSPIEIFAEKITNTIIKLCKLYRLQEPILLLEPGRFISSNAQILLLRVNTIKKRKKGINFAITDGGRVNIAYPVSNEYHQIFVANRMNNRNKQRYHIVGGVCTPGDWLCLGRMLPSLSAGDILAVMDAGAYFSSYANNFSFPRPAIVVVAGGAHNIIRQRETYDYMIAGDFLNIAKAA